MNTLHSSTCIMAVFAICFSIVGCDGGAANRAAVEQARAQVRRIADELDKQTTESGVYIRVKENEVKETDPWGSRIQVRYSQGGVAETVSVRSAGPDRKWHTDDDVVAQGATVNLKGIGEGIKKNAEEAAAKAAKGLVKGAAAGVKESVRDALPHKKKKGDSDLKADEVQQSTEPVRDNRGD